jgi:hypothetical protein
MAIPMWVNGEAISEMDREHGLWQTVLNTKENGKMMSCHENKETR